MQGKLKAARPVTRSPASRMACEASKFRVRDTKTLAFHGADVEIARMNESAKQHDPRNLIGDALVMEGLTVEENRSIFFDWAFGLKEPEAASESAKALLAVYRTGETAAHPMIRLLEQAAAGPAARRGRTNRRREAAKRWEEMPDG